MAEWNTGLLRWCCGKESICQCRRHRRHRFYPWVGKIPWRRKWKFIPIFLPGKFHGQKSLAGYSPWGCKVSDTPERLSTHILALHQVPVTHFRVCLQLRSMVLGVSLSTSLPWGFPGFKGTAKWQQIHTQQVHSLTIKKRHRSKRPVSPVFHRAILRHVPQGSLEGRQWNWALVALLVKAYFPTSCAFSLVCASPSL